MSEGWEIAVSAIPEPTARQAGVVDFWLRDSAQGFSVQASCGVEAACSQSTLSATRQAAHPHCLLCGADNVQGLALDFQVQPDGSVRAVFAGGDRYEGYPDTLHGGLIAALLDSAMTNCLFARGIVAVTARLNVCYVQPARLGLPMEVVATVERSRRSLHYLAAEVCQDGNVVASAFGAFADRQAR